MGKAADESIARMKERGVTFVEIDRKPFIESMAGFYQEMENRGELPKGFLAAVEATRARCCSSDATVAIGRRGPPFTPLRHAPGAAAYASRSFGLAPVGRSAPSPFHERKKFAASLTCTRSGA